MGDIIIKHVKRKTTIPRAAIRKAVHEAYEKLRRGETRLLTEAEVFGNKAKVKS